MEAVLAVGALVAAGYLITTSEQAHPEESRSDTLVNYYVPGSTFEDISTALKKGYRLIELHVYSDAQDQPIVSLKPHFDGITTRSFESCCVDLVNDAFPSKDPLILSLVLHTEKNFTINRIAYHLKTTLHKQFCTQSIEDAPLDSLANKLIVVSGNEARGTDLEPLMNLCWNDSHLRRLSYQQAAFPREPEELRLFAASHLVLVAPDQAFARYKVMDDIQASGCQWNVCPCPSGRVGFIPRV